MVQRQKLVNIVIGALVVGGAAVLFAALSLVIALYFFSRGLPDYSQLAKYEPPVVTRIQAGDGSLLAEFAREKRLFVPIEAIPQRVVDAFLAAEDKNFFEHGGLDYAGIARAMVYNIGNFVTGHRPVGASTITQQVAKNFLLSGEVSYKRKIKEAILAFRIERAFTKRQILELYLNEIYLGSGSYGVAAAASNYFNKSLGELTLQETAYLAALPKAPNNYNPIKRHAAAVARRNWVIGRMQEDDLIGRLEAEQAQAAPLVTRRADRTKVFRADFYTEEVRRKLYDLYGEKKLYEGGLVVRTTLSPRLQAIAEQKLRAGLVNYDRGHGWRGPLAHLDLGAKARNGVAPKPWNVRLAAEKHSLGIPSWRQAVVLAVTPEQAVIGFEDQSRGVIPLSEVKWARKWLPDQQLGVEVLSVQEVLKVGDVIATEAIRAEPVEGRPPQPGNLFALRQIPDIEGALVAMDPHTGRVLAMVGGFDYQNSEFNRVTQALRQPGSAFKPFVYAAALDAGFTPSSLVLDAPFVIDQGGALGIWKPSNYSDDFYGASTLRTGIEQSRNLMTVRLAHYIGMNRVVKYAKKFGIQDNMLPTLAMSLGAGETTVLKLTTAYAMLVNGGKRVEPIMIDRVQDRYGHTVLRRDARECPGCQVAAWGNQPPPVLVDKREQVIDARTAYQVVSMLQGVVERGTGHIVASVGKPVAGKTGTTNDFRDAWFLGFTPDLVVGVYVGFDKPRTLGRGEQGAAVAAPIFRDFMTSALKGKPGIPFRIPPGIRLVRVDVKTGLPASASAGRTILEAFVSGNETAAERQILDGADSLVQTNTKVRVGTGGLY